MKNWKFIKVGNAEPKVTEISGKYGSGVVERMSNQFFVSYNLNNEEKGIEKFQTEAQAVSFLKKKVGNEGGTVKISLFKSPSNHSWVPGINDRMIEGAPEFKGAWGKDEALKWTKEWAEKHGLKVGNKKACNESIDKQEWSMFKGLTKKAEEEVGNESIGDEYNAEIQRLTKKAEQLRRMGQGKSAMEIEKQIEKLGKELREIGNNKVGNTNWKQTGSQKWETELPNGSKIVVYYEKGEMADWNYQIDHKKSNTYIGSWARDKQEAMTESVERAKRLGNSTPGSIASIGPAWMYGGTVYGKMDTDESGKKHNEYVKITWLGSGKGGVANYFIDDKMQSEKFGSLDKNELKRWAEQKIGNSKIGNTAHSDKVEVIKRLLAGGWSVEDIYSQLKTEGYEVEKNFIEKLKTGNETLAEYAKSKPRIINETKAERKFGKVMGEFEEGALKTPQGKTVTDPAQAKAIAYSEADKVDNLKRARNAMKNKK